MDFVPPSVSLRYIFSKKRKERKERKKREEGEEKKSENGVGGSIFYMERNNSVDEQGIMVLFGLGVIEGAG